MGSQPLVGFTGSRSLPSRFSPLVGAVVQSVVQSGRGVAVGDASGADAFVRFRAQQCGVTPRVFRPSLYGGRRVAGALAHRSAAMVRAVQQSVKPQAATRSGSGGSKGAGVVGFVSSACPVHPRSGKRLVPSRSSVRCFGGFGSGTWSTLAFAVALRLPVVVFACGVSHWAALPSHWGGIWVATGVAGAFGLGYQFVALQRAQVGVPFQQPWQR